MFEVATADFFQSLRLFPVWSYLAAKDIAGKYRRTILGPFWVTLNTAIIIFGMGIVWSYVLKTDMRTYFPYLAAGLIVWNLFSALVSDGTFVFAIYSNIIKEIQIPYFTYIFLIVFKNFLLSAHNIIVYVIIAFFFDVGISSRIFLLFPGLIILFFTAIFACLLLGMICSRYADLSSSVNSLFGLLFFLTPIVWQTDNLSSDVAYIAFYNPLTHFVSIIRDPLLNKVPALSSYGITLGCTLLLGAIAMLLFNKYQRRIVYWI